MFLSMALKKQKKHLGENTIMSYIKSKELPLKKLVGLVKDGASVALGGSFLHRGPFCAVRELIRQGKKNLNIIKQSPGYDIDLLCRAGVASEAKVGIVAMEGNFGLAPWYRKAVEEGHLKIEEHSCATLTAGLRAAAYGVPFQPCGGIDGSELIDINGWQWVTSPYDDTKGAWVIPAIQPDVAILQANEVDEQGNVRVRGTPHWDRIMSRSAKKVYIIAERKVGTQSFKDSPEMTLIPHFMVDAYSIVPNGAWPGSCWPEYEVDYEAVEEYLNGDLASHLNAAPEVTKKAIAKENNAS